MFLAFAAKKAYPPDPSKRKGRKRSTKHSDNGSSAKAKRVKKLQDKMETLKTKWEEKWRENEQTRMTLQARLKVAKRDAKTIETQLKKIYKDDSSATDKRILTLSSGVGAQTPADNPHDGVDIFQFIVDPQLSQDSVKDMSTTIVPAGATETSTSRAENGQPNSSVSRLPNPSISSWQKARPWLCFWKPNEKNQEPWNEDRKQKSARGGPSGDCNTHETASTHARHGVRQHGITFSKMLKNSQRNVDFIVPNSPPLTNPRTDTDSRFNVTDARPTAQTLEAITQRPKHARHTKELPCVAPPSPTTPRGQTNNLENRPWITPRRKVQITQNEQACLKEVSKQVAFSCAQAGDVFCSKLWGTYKMG